MMMNIPFFSLHIKCHLLYICAKALIIEALWLYCTCNILDVMKEEHMRDLKFVIFEGLRGLRVVFARPVCGPELFVGIFDVIGQN